MGRLLHMGRPGRRRAVVVRRSRRRRAQRPVGGRLCLSLLGWEGRGVDPVVGVRRMSCIININSSSSSNFTMDMATTPMGMSMSQGGVV